MRKGISPIVAVVLLIAIAVIAAVGLYFWVGGLATKQPTPDAPIVISAQAVTCATGISNVTALIQNLDASGDITAERLGLVADNGTCWSDAVTIAASNQGSVEFNCAGNGTTGATNYSVADGNKYVIYSNSTTTSMGQAQIVC